MVFVNSMSDVFHELIPFEFIDDIFQVMESCPKHIFQVLTKRPNVMADWFIWKANQSSAASYAPPPNIWLGTSVENTWAADRRISHLVSLTATVRFLSCEPLLGPLDLRNWLNIETGVNWVIVGGESGPKHRRMDGEWARDIRDQCLAAGIPFFFKQWGGRTPKSGGRELDGRLWDEMPQVDGPGLGIAQSDQQSKNLDFLTEIGVQ